ncbi:MAG: hypothetical protein CFE25_06465 [Chitinophagaceae bacterium BSSC1]|nr:MAG: hypothetical protein CFE25_06465 [Chitinophagaceae bacterium BSSC1]
MNKFINIFQAGCGLLGILDRLQHVVFKKLGRCFVCIFFLQCPEILMNKGFQQILIFYNAKKMDQKIC